MSEDVIGHVRSKVPEEDLLLVRTANRVCVGETNPLAQVKMAVVTKDESNRLTRLQLQLATDDKASWVACSVISEVRRNDDSGQEWVDCLKMRGGFHVLPEKLKPTTENDRSGVWAIQVKTEAGVAKSIGEVGTTTRSGNQKVGQAMEIKPSVIWNFVLVDENGKLERREGSYYPSDSAMEANIEACMNRMVRVLNQRDESDWSPDLANIDLLYEIDEWRKALEKDCVRLEDVRKKYKESELVFKRIVKAHLGKDLFDFLACTDELKKSFWVNLSCWEIWDKLVKAYEIETLTEKRIFDDYIRATVPNSYEQCHAFILETKEIFNMLERFGNGISESAQVEVISHKLQAVKDLDSRFADLGRLLHGDTLKTYDSLVNLLMKQSNQHCMQQSEMQNVQNMLDERNSKMGGNEGRPGVAPVQGYGFGSRNIPPTQGSQGGATGFNKKQGFGSQNNNQNNSSTKRLNSTQRGICRTEAQRIGGILDINQVNLNKKVSSGEEYDKIKTFAKSVFGSNIQGYCLRCWGDALHNSSVCSSCPGFITVNPNDSQSNAYKGLDTGIIKPNFFLKRANVSKGSKGEK
jgi:hypothetical protein